MRHDAPVGPVAGGGAPEDPEPRSDSAIKRRLRQLAENVLRLPLRIDELEERVVFRLDVGVGFDGGQPSDKPLASGRPLDESGTYERLLVYTFGDVVLGSRGLVVPSLTTYFASQFRFNQNAQPPSDAVPSVYDGADSGGALLVRSGWGELTNVFSSRLLKPFWLRAGRMFHYGPAIAHFDGLSFGYDTPAFSASGFSGQRVSLYGLDEALGRDTTDRLITGLAARLDLGELRKVPLVASFDLLRFEGVRHLEGALAWRRGRNLLVSASLRLRGGRVSRERLELRARVAEVTTLHAEVENRTDADWVYDLIVSDRGYDPSDPRRHLDLGAPLPRLRLSARAGTVLLRNIDVLVHATAAIEHGDTPERPPSSFSSSYVEAGGAVDVHLRRSLQVGASVMARDYRRQDLPLLDDQGPRDLLVPATGALGESSFYEGAGSIDYTLGARRFSAGAELYGRAYRLRSPHQALIDADTRLGTRVYVEGWTGNRIRLKAEYDTASVPALTAPELVGIKSLRVIAEGAF